MESQKPTRIINRVYLSSLRVANNESLLISHRITHVLTICPIRPTHFANITYKLVSISDSPTECISQYFEECFSFIQEALSSNGSILIHCFQGISRSVSIVLAYLMTFHQMSLPEAINYTKHRRPQINPNFGFLNQLKSYESTLLTNYPQ